MLQAIIDYVPDDFYTWMDCFFFITGLLPPKDTTKKIIYLFLAVPNTFVCLFLLTGLEMMQLKIDFHKDFKTAMFNLNVVVLDSIIIVRLIFWIFTKGKFAKIREIIQRPSLNFDCFSVRTINCEKMLNEVKKSKEELNYNDLKKLWRMATVDTSQKRNKMEAFRKQTMAQTRLLCCLMYLSLNFICIFTLGFTYVTVLYTDTFEQFNPSINATSTYRAYPYQMYFPFDTSLSHGHYWWGYFYQIYAYIVVLSIFIPIMTVVTNTVIHIISQTVIVAEALRQIDKGIDASQSLDAVLLIKEIRLVKCISELQEIYRAIYFLEELCNVQLLIQYGGSVFILCTLCYVIPLVNTIGEVVISAVFLTTTLGEIFIFSYCSATLSLELENVWVPVYGLEWANYTPKMKKNLLFLLSRIQKPGILTAGKIFRLDLPFFIQVVQKSYSFYTLISNTST